MVKPNMKYYEKVPSEDGNNTADVDLNASGSRATKSGSNRDNNSPFKTSSTTEEETVVSSCLI